MKIRVDFGHSNIRDTNIDLPAVPRKGDIVIIPIEKVKLIEGKFTTYDDIFKVKFVMWDAEANDVSIIVKNSFEYENNN